MARPSLLPLAALLLVYFFSNRGILVRVVTTRDRVAPVTTGEQARYIFYDMRLQRSENGGTRPTLPLPIVSPPHRQRQRPSRGYGRFGYGHHDRFRCSPSVRSWEPRSCPRLRPDINGAHAKRWAANVGRMSPAHHRCGTACLPN